MKEAKKKVLMENLMRLLSGEAAPYYLTEYGFEYGRATGARIDPDKLEPVMEFIRAHLRKTEHVNPSQTSYSLKSLYGRCNGNKQVSNGLFIAAMLACGYKCRVVKPYSLEVCFDVSAISPKKEDGIKRKVTLEKTRESEILTN